MKDKSKRLTVVNTGKKEEKVQSTVVVSAPAQAHSSSSPGFNSALYLLKSVWDSVFEIKTDVSGQKYIFGKIPVVTQYGITMYADDGSFNLPSIYDGLPIDGQTLIWDETDGGKILKINPNIELGGGLDEVELYNYLTNNNYAQKSDITTALSGYATTSSLNAVSTKLNDFLEGSDTDTVINKWKELETFLSGLSESDNLATILTGKADKSYVDTNFVTLGTKQTITGEKNFTGGLKVNGIPIYKSQDDVLYIDGNLVVRGGVTMYAENEVDIPSIIDSLPIASTSEKGIAKFDSTYFSVDSNGMVSLTSAPSSGVSSLGELLNVDASIDATASVDRVLYQPAGSSTWTWKELTSSGVVGDYLPLSGGRLYGNLGINIDRSVHGLHVKGSVAIGQNTSGTATIDAFESMAFFGCDAVNNGTFTSPNGAFIAINGDTGNIAIGHTGALYKLDIAADTNQIVRVVSVGNQEASIRYTNNSWKSWVAGIGAGKAGDYFGIWSETLGYSPLLCNTEGAVIVDQVTYIAGGSIGFNRNTKYGGRFNTSYNGWQFHIDTSNSRFYVYTEGTNSGLKAYWDTSGNYLVYGGITMYSDKRKKTILNHVELSLKQIANAPLIEHYYNSDQNKTTHVGSIAQYWAGLNDWFCKLDNEGYYTMEIQNCALASAISIARHLEKYESKTDKTIRKMKKRIQELEDEVERLKQN